MSLPQLRATIARRNVGSELFPILVNILSSFKAICVTPPGWSGRTIPSHSLLIGAFHAGLAEPSHGPRSGPKHIAEGGARLCERNPRTIVLDKLRRKAGARRMRARLLSPLCGAETLNRFTRGCARKASFHPGLYALACFAGEFAAGSRVIDFFHAYDARWQNYSYGPRRDARFH